MRGGHGPAEWGRASLRRRRRTRLPLNEAVYDQEGRMLIERFGFKINPYVFLPSAGLTLVFVILGFGFPRRTEAIFSKLQTFIVDQFGWFYILSVALFLGFVIWLAFSRYSQIKLGADDSEPDYGFGTWLAMLFSTGDPRTIDAARRALNLSFFHWGLHAWAIYAVVGLALGYVAHRQGLPLTIRSAFYPLFGERIHGAIGNAIDTFAVFGTLFGLATSLGFGAMQISAAITMALPFCVIMLMMVYSLLVGLRAEAGELEQPPDTTEA